MHSEPSWLKQKRLNPWVSPATYQGERGRGIFKLNLCNLSILQDILKYSILQTKHAAETEHHILQYIYTYL